MKKAFFIIFAFAALAVTGESREAYASNEGVMCAQVMPCGEDGTVWPEFAGGECGEYYARICSVKKGVPSIKDEVTCTDAVQKLSKENAKLKRLNRRLKAAARTARR